MSRAHGVVVGAALSLGAAALWACGGGTPPVPSPTPLRVADAAPPDAAPPDAAPPDAAPPDAAPPDAAPPDAAPPDAAEAAALPATDPPAVKGERLRIAQGRSATSRDGLTVTYVSHGHKMYADGSGGTQWLSLRVERDGKAEALEIRGDDDPLDAEVVARGTLLVLRGSYERLDVVVVGKAPRPLDEDAAAERAHAEAARRGLPEPDGSGYATDNGVLRLEARQHQRPVWRARVGLYTRRIWFKP